MWNIRGLQYPCCFCISLVCDIGWWHIAQICLWHLFCTIQLPEMCEIPWQCKQNILKADVALKHCACVWDADLWCFGFFSPHLPRWWGGQCWTWHAEIYTRESVLSSRVAAPSLSPSMSCFTVCQLHAASWYWWHPCWGADQIHIWTQFPVVLRSCWPSFQQWLLFPVSSWCVGELWCTELGGCVWTRSKAEAGFWVVPKDRHSPCLCSMASCQPAHRCPHPELQHPGRMFPPHDSNQMVFRKQKHLKHMAFAMVFAAHRKELTFVERVGLM